MAGSSSIGARDAERSQDNWREAQARLERKVDQLASDFQEFVIEGRGKLLVLKMGKNPQPTTISETSALTQQMGNNAIEDIDRRQIMTIDTPDRFHQLGFE